MRVKAFLTGQTTRADRVVAAFICTFLLLLALSTRIIRNRALIEDGGLGYMHGEWLINFEGGLVRRGAAGWILLPLSDALQVSPLVLVEVMQGIAVFSVILGVLCVLWFERFAPRLVVLAISPAFIVSWHNDFVSNAKEIWALTSMIPLAYAAISRRTSAALALSLTIFASACFFHEPSVLLVPFLLTAAVAVCLREQQWKRFSFYALGVLGTAGAATVFVNVFSHIDDWREICAPLLERGLGEHICNSAIVWTSNTPARALELTLEHSSNRPWLSILATIFLAYMPIILMLYPHPRYRLLVVAVVLGGLTFIPLYFVAVDYGRWLVVQIGAITMTLMVVTSSGYLKQLRFELSRWMLWILIAVALSWRVAIVQGSIGAGVLEPVVKWVAFNALGSLG